MPTISMFYGIVIRMYCGAAEHGPPHFHAYYQNYKAMVEIATGELIEGELPTRQRRLVMAWVELHRDELMADWNLASQGELPFKILKLSRKRLSSRSSRRPRRLLGCSWPDADECQGNLHGLRASLVEGRRGRRPERCVGIHCSV